MTMSFAGQTAIAGIGATEFSKDSGRSELQLAVEASEPPRSPTPASSPPRSTAWSRFTADDQPRDRDRPQPRASGELTFFSPHPPRRRRGLRHRPAGGHGGGRGCRRRTCVVYRAFNERSGHPLRHRRAGPPAGGDAEEADFALVRAPSACSRPAQWVAMFARRYMHEYGATSEDFGRGLGRRPQARGHQPEGLVLRAADHARGPPGQPLDRRARCTCSTAARRATAARPSSSPPSSGPATCRSRRRSSRRPPRARRGPADDDELLPGLDHRASPRWAWSPASSGTPGRRRPRRHPDRGPLRPLHAVRAAAARGVRLLRPGRGQGLHAGRRTSRSAAGCRSTPTAASSARPTSTA